MRYARYLIPLIFSLLLAPRGNVLPAVVLVHLVDPPLAARTDDRGRISLPRFDSTPLKIEVRAEGLAPWGEVVAPDPDAGPVRVGLRAQ